MDGKAIYIFKAELVIAPAPGAADNTHATEVTIMIGNIGVLGGIKLYSKYELTNNRLAVCSRHNNNIYKIKELPFSGTNGNYHLYINI